MARCFAASFGGCTQMSGEHVLSRSLFDDGASIYTSGLKVPEGKPFHIDSLVANILCAKHNSDLSPLDSEAKKLGDAAFAFRSGGVSQTVDLDGWLIERWMLKCAVGARAAGWVGEKLQVAPEVAKGVFGHAPLPPDLALYGIADVSAPPRPRRHVTCSQFPGDAPVSSGWIFIVHGVALMLSRGLKRPNEILRLQSDLVGFDLTNATCVRRPREYAIVRQPDRATLILRFQYGGLTAMGQELRSRGAK